MSGTAAVLSTPKETGLPISPPTGLLANGLLVLAGSLLLAGGAQVAVPLPFSPVPVTGQTLAVLLLSFTVGWKRAGLSVLAYLAEGAAGLPFFAGGAGGFVHLMGPTGGYLAGFLPAALAAGWLAERGWGRNVVMALFTCLIALSLLFLCGLVWLSVYVPSEGLLAAGLFPFIPGALVKAGLVTVGLPAAHRLLPRG